MKTTEDLVKDVFAQAENDKQLIDRAAKRKAELVVEQERKRAAIQEANRIAAKAADDLRASLEQDFGIENHPRREMLWQKAWEYGHSYGLSEVECVYRDLAELLEG